MEQVVIQKVVQVGSWLVEVSLGFSSSLTQQCSETEPPPTLGVRLVRPCVAAAAPGGQLPTPIDAQEDGEEEERTRAPTPKRKRALDDDARHADDEDERKRTKKTGRGGDDDALSPLRAVVWTDMPSEVQLHVLSQLPVLELVSSVPLVCRDWHQLARDPQLWLSLHRRRLGCDPLVIDLDCKRRLPWRTPTGADSSLRVQHRSCSDEEDDVLMVSCMTNLLVPLRLERAGQRDMMEVETRALKRQRDAWFSRGLAALARECCVGIERLHEAIALLGDQDRFKEASSLERFGTAIRLNRDDLAWVEIEHSTSAIKKQLASFEGISVLTQITSRDNTDLMRRLVEGGVITQAACDHAFVAGLTRLIEDDNVELVRRRLEAGVVLGSNCTSLLALVVSRPETEARREMAKLLIDRGGNIADPAVIRSAAAALQEGTMLMLLERGVDPAQLLSQLKAQRNIGFSGFGHWTAMNRCVSLVETWAAMRERIGE